MSKINRKQLINIIKAQNENIEVPNLKQNINQNIKQSYILNQPIKEQKQEKVKLNFKLKTMITSFCILIMALTIVLINIKNDIPTITGNITKEKQAYVMQATSLFNFASDDIYNNELTPLTYTSINNKNTNDYEAISNDILNNLYTVEEFFNKEKNKYELFELQNEQYQYKLIVYMDIEQVNISYTMYYNETVLYDKDFDKDIDEVSSKITGYIECNNIKYNIEGIKEVEKDETETELKLYLSESNFIIVEQEIEKRENEYTYIFYENNKMVKEIEISMETKNNKQILELSVDNKETHIEEEYEFIKNKNKIFVSLEKNDVEMEITINISKDIYEFDFGNGIKITQNRNINKENKNFSKFTNKNDQLIVL